MLESEKDLVAKTLRAVLQSNKHGVLLSRLQAEYRSLTGEHIPFKEMGFTTLDAYLKAIPSVVKIEINRLGEVNCFAVVCKETAQIAELVARQRTAKKKSGGQVNCQMRLKYNSGFTHIGTPKATLRKPSFSPSQEKITKKPVSSSVKGKGNTWFGRSDSHPIYSGGLLRDVPLQRQITNLNRPDTKATLPPRFQQGVTQRVFHSSQTYSNANTTQAVKPVISSISPSLSVVQNNLRDLLHKNSSGIWMSKLPQFYKDTFKQDLSDEMLRQIVNWTHICMAQKLIISGQPEIVLYPQLKKQNTTVKNTQQSSDQVKQNLPPVLSKQQSFPKQTESLMTDSELKQKISQILTKYSSGLWSHALPRIFEETFKIKFPDELLMKLDSFSDICTVDLISKTPYKAIIYAKDTGKEDQNVSLNKRTINESSNKKPEKETPPLTEHLSKEPDIDISPPPLVIPSEASPSVLVVELTNTNEVVVRYVGEQYSAAQEHMEDQMKLLYSQNPSSIHLGSIKLGQLVAVKAEEDAWLRAQISSIENNKIKICYVDYGFSEIVDCTKVQVLAKQFYSLAFQATKCRLAGLEAFCEDSAILKAVESKACGKILAVEILEKSEKPLVVLYDTSGDDDININAACLRELCDKSLNLQLKVNSSYTNVVVTNVCSDGTLICHVPSKGLSKLYDILQRIESYFNSKQITSDFFVSLPFCGKICLLNCKGRWSRVEITNVHSSRALDVQYLDTGTLASVKVSELREIPTTMLRDVISIPPQAIKCCLADLPSNIGMWTPDAVLWLRNTVLNCSECSIKVVKIDERKGLVYVYLFTPKNYPDPEQSINHQLTNEDLWKHQKDVFLSVISGGASLARSKVNPSTNSAGMPHAAHTVQANLIKKPFVEQSSTLSTLDLPPPLPLPKPGEHMDIFVSLACHPGHFVFQPWQELHKLEVVMEEMLLHYSTTEEKPVAVEKNKLYAAKVDNKWYRVLLKGILTNGLVSVYELDYGRHELVSCRKVQPLIDKFRQLPFQAITSQLAGVKRDHWSEEASIVFRNHVEKKPLVALVQTVCESSNPWDRKVVAYLVDTLLPDTDIWVHDLMSEYLVELSKTD